MFLSSLVLACNKQMGDVLNEEFLTIAFCLYLAKEIRVTKYGDTLIDG